MENFVKNVRTDKVCFLTYYNDACYVTTYSVSGRLADPVVILSQNTHQNIEILMKNESKHQSMGVCKLRT